MEKMVFNGSERMFYSVSEVAAMFNISEKSVYRLLERGLLKSSSALRHKRISRESVEKFVDSTTRDGN
jgi:excisionase family DNA binding protein